MEIVTQPDIYMPSIDENGNYIDKIPTVHIMKNGLQCSCGSRKDKTYTSSTFSSHIKTKIHQKWLNDLNLNKLNYYVENEKNKEIIQNQRLIIAKLEKDIHSLTNTIHVFTTQLTNQNQDINDINLLDFD
jgi:hypothetical protein